MDFITIHVDICSPKRYYMVFSKFGHKLVITGFVKLDSVHGHTCTYVEMALYDIRRMDVIFTYFSLTTLNLCFFSTKAIICCKRSCGTRVCI